MIQIYIVKKCKGGIVMIRVNGENIEGAEGKSLKEFFPTII